MTKDFWKDYVPEPSKPADGTQVSKVWWDGEKLMAKPIPLEDFYPPVQDSTCSETLRAQGKAYPRTCRKCGKGPCIGAPKPPPAQPAPVQSCYCPNCEAMGKELAALKAQSHANDLTHDQWDAWQDKHGLILERDALDDLLSMLVAQPAPVPLTDEQKRELIKESKLWDMHIHMGWYSAPAKSFVEKTIQLIADIEAAHGITKGQP
jgi:hypothetical protein